MALPLALRNPLAALILDAFDDEESLHTLRMLVAFGPGHEARLRPDDAAMLDRLGWFRRLPGGTLEVVGRHRVHWPTVHARAASAVSLFGGGALPPRDSLAGLLGRAARLADRGLFFEVHELLEPAWLRAAGAERLGLQGLIQIAVALHHSASGNAEGARSLLAEGLSKLLRARGGPPGSTKTWEAALQATLAALRDGRRLPTLPPWPAEVPWRSS